MRYTGPKVGLSRRAGVPLIRRAVEAFERRPRPPEDGRATGEYGLRLLEKQKLRRYYDLPERHLRRTFERARRRPGATGDELLVALETRLASVVLRTGFAPSILAARQYITEGHITVDGEKVDVPSHRVRRGDIVAVRERSRGLRPFVAAAEGAYADERTAPYLNVNLPELTAMLRERPAREQIELPVDEQLVVEYYSG